MRVLEEAYERLLTAYGPQGWWPAESAFEVVVGAVLVQNTAWRNVERAIVNLRADDRLSVARLDALSQQHLEKLIRPAGFFRVKARRLRNLIRLIVDEHEASLDALFELPTDELRAALLSVNGIGPETADAILLYAAGRPRFVIDAYTRRVLERHGWADASASYAELQQRFEAELPADVEMFNEYHALLVEVGKRQCGPTADCEGCPLAVMLPMHTEPRS